MAPTTPGAGSGHTTPADAGIFSHSLVPFPTEQLPGLPTPHEMRVGLTQQLNEAVARIRKERGEVHGREDTYPLIRSVHGVNELYTAYSKAILAVTKVGTEVIEEELVAAVGEQEGIPTSNLTVPQGGTNITITRKTHNEYFIDTQQVLGALTALVEAEWRADFAAGRTDVTPSSEPEQFAMSVAERALAMVGAADLKVTHVRALAADLAGAGEDKLSGVVTDAIRSNRKFDGVSVKRTERKRAA